ncbi:hypothetical protein GCM10023095_30350 [Pseudaeromonas paramecii]|uniref:Uncharacterized protein n=1 Tax=Pseudaeromonas paramecii TaxID=2138166 RepID=A0ABP8QJV2_9GAMM
MLFQLAIHGATVGSRDDVKTRARHVFLQQLPDFLIIIHDKDLFAFCHFRQTTQLSGQIEHSQRGKCKLVAGLL